MPGLALGFGYLVQAIARSQLGISFPTPVAIGIGVNSVTAAAYATGNSTAKLSKTGNIDTQQDLVGAVHDSDICKLWKASTHENESELLAKIHDGDQFGRLRDRCMVPRVTCTIPTGKPAGAGTPKVQVCGAGS